MRETLPPLWISSLTDRKAVLEGNGQPGPGSLYDNMFQHGQPNKAGTGYWDSTPAANLHSARRPERSNSLGRCRHPVLVSISSRYRERTHYHGRLSVYQPVQKVTPCSKMMRCTEEFTDREAAARLYSDANWPDMHAHHRCPAGRSGEIEPPALCDRTPERRQQLLTRNDCPENHLKSHRDFMKKLISLSAELPDVSSTGRLTNCPYHGKILNGRIPTVYPEAWGSSIFDLPDKVVDGQAAERTIIITDTYRKD